MAADYFLKIDGIPEESAADSKHSGEISILSWSWGETQPVAPGPGGGGGGKVSMQDFRFSKAVDKSTPKLMLACASGQQIKDAVLSCRKAGGTSQDFLAVTLTEVTITSYEMAGNSGAAIGTTDQFALHFAKVQFNYLQQKPDGTTGERTHAGWDLTNNKPA